MNKDLIRIKVISEKTGLSTATIRNYIKQKKLRAIKIGGNYYTTLEDYNKLILTFYANDIGLTLEQFKAGIIKLRQEEYAKRNVSENRC